MLLFAGIRVIRGEIFKDFITFSYKKGASSLQPDYLIVGSGLAALSFGALMAKAGRRVRVLEAHYLSGGYGHTFEMDGYKFNAQLHYVWNCGEGGTVHKVLQRLGLADTVRFHEYDANGFDRMRIPGFALDIPYDYDLLIKRLQEQFPQDGHYIARFVYAVRDLSAAIDKLPGASFADWAVRYDSLVFVDQKALLQESALDNWTGRCL